MGRRASNEMTDAVHGADLDEVRLEELAAHETPSRKGAHWITLQATEHLLASTSPRDPLTGRPRPVMLREVLRSIRQVLAGGARPLPYDVGQRALDLCLEAIGNILREPRTKIVRQHEMRPLHAVREMDEASMRWLARQPGRTAKEKLAGQRKAKAVVRRFSVDTLENRVVCRVVQELRRYVEQRLDAAAAYSDGVHPSIDELEDALRLLRNKFQRSELAFLSLGYRPQPTNVLLDDRDYSRVWRAYQMLLRRDDVLEKSWVRVGERTAGALFWSFVALLAEQQGVQLWEGPIILRDPGNEAIALRQPSNLASWSDQPSVTFVLESSLNRDKRGHTQKSSADEGRTRLRIIELSLRGHTINVEIGALASLSNESATSLFQFEYHVGVLEFGRLESQRGQPLRLFRTVKSRVSPLLDGFADIGGIGEASHFLVRELLRLFGSQPEPSLDSDSTSISNLPGAAVSPLGLDLGTSRPRVFGNSKQRTSVHAVGVRRNLPDSEVLWSVEQPDSPALPPGTSGQYIPFAEVFDAESASVELAHAYRAGRAVAQQLASELGSDQTRTIGVAIPDTVDAISRSRIRNAISKGLGKCFPVWRSVAAATGWQAKGELDVEESDLVLVVDAEAPSLTMTPLVARHVQELEEAVPDSAGILWERRPSLATTDIDDVLTYRQIQLDYAEQLLKEHGLHKRAALAQQLVASGRIERLLEEGRIVMPVDGTSDQWLVLRHSAKLWERLVTTWKQLFEERLADVFAGRTVQELLGELEKGVPRKILMVGRPFRIADADVADVASLDAGLAGRSPNRQWGTVKFASLQKGFGFASRETGEDVFMHPNNCASSGFFEGLKKGAIVSFVPGTAGAKPNPPAHVILPGSNHLIADAGVVATGANLLAARHEADLPTWQDWLQNMAVEVIRDGHYEILPLIAETERGVAAGETVDIDVPANLIPPAASSSCILPMVGDERTRRSLGIEGHVRLDKITGNDDSTLRGRFSYKHGIERNWELVLRAEVEDAAARVSASWHTEGKTWDQIADRNFLVPPYDDRGCAPAKSVDEAARIFDRIEKAALAEDLEAGRTEVWNLKDALGDGKGERRELVERLLELLHRWNSGDEFNPALSNAAVGVLGSAIWRDPELVGTLADSAKELFGRASRSLRNVLARLPELIDEVSEGKVARKVLRKYESPYENACRLLLGLFRLRSGDTVDFLTPGRPQLVRLARTVRRIDSLLVGAGLRPAVALPLSVEVPRHLRRMSQLGYATMCYLAGYEEPLLRVAE
ncbi:DUF2357 domain-containing protein [Persicimonas caeni]|nr:DUF2357 domain-containing protein [Persicimonas caeni]